MVGSELLCPDCGGVVGATEPTEAGSPCTCFTDRSARHDESMAGVESPVAPVAKICRLCGVDVTGKKRVRDPHGYYCYECHKAEEFKLNGGRIRCQSCGHLTKPESLTDYEGKKICRTCHAEKLETRKRAIAQMGFRGARTRYEGKQALVWAGILGMLLVIIVLSTLYVHFRHG